jgi:hypothetical protein
MAGSNDNRTKILIGNPSVVTGSSKDCKTIKRSPYTYPYIQLCVSADGSILLWTRSETAHNGFFTMILFSYSFLPYPMHIHEVQLYVHVLLFKLCQLPILMHNFFDFAHPDA